MTDRLFSWIAAPTTATNPLPSLSEAGRRGWPVLALAELLAGTLAARGLAYSRATGFVQYGAPLTTYGAAREAALWLRIAADDLAPPRPPSGDLAEQHAMLTEASDAAQRRAHEMTDDYEEAEAMAPTLDPSAAISAPVLYARLQDRRALAAIDADADARRRHWSEHAAALRLTARAITASPTVQARLLQALRQLLPVPPRVDPGAAAGAWLARLDAEEAAPRPALGRAYRDDGAPGGLRPRELYALATDRWGAPIKRSGVYTYRPARGTHARG